MPKLLTIAMLVVLTTGCRERSDQAGEDELGPPTAVKGPPLANDAPRAMASAVAPSPRVADDAALRRAYGPKEMKLHPCAKLDGEGTIVGKQCPSAFVVFGPYVEAPGNAKLGVSFEIESDAAVDVTSDVVSEVGKRFHGSIDEEKVPSNERRRFGYSLQLSERVVALEARVGIRAPGPVDFKLSKLAIVVQ